MWEDNHTEWTHFRQDVLAADRAAAKTLVRFLRTVDQRQLYKGALEILDLQRYRIIRHPQKVLNTLHSRMHMPFIFAVGLN